MEVKYAVSNNIGFEKIAFKVFSVTNLGTNLLLIAAEEPPFSLINLEVPSNY